MIHQPSFLESLDVACREWQQLLGASGIFRSPETLQHYARTTLPDAPTPAAVVRPEHVSQVAPIVQVASAHGIPLYPISRGRNWGWGDACPVGDGQVILDLSQLNRIVEINEALGYAVLQPGVSQGQLTVELARLNSNWWVDSTAAGPETSMVGNVIERGITREERMAQVCGMEVVLADGTTVRTGFGHYPGSRVTHVARWGVGPSIDGLFSQSNLAIVTELGLWLQPKPAYAERGYFTIPDPSLEEAIDILRPLYLNRILPAQPIFLAPIPGGAPLWFGVVTLQGSQRLVAAYRQELAGLVTEPMRIIFPSPDVAQDAAARTATLAALGLPTIPFFDATLQQTDPLAGPQLSPTRLLAFLGGEAVQHPTTPPTSTDPRDHDYGFYFLWLTSPAIGAEVRGLLDIVKSRLTANAFPPLLSLRFVNGRSIVLVMRIAFDRKRDERRTAARSCYYAILDAAIAAGFPPARMGIDGMDRLDPAGDSYWKLVRRIKRCLDPEQILAPGRYVPPAPE